MVLALVLGGREAELWRELELASVVRVVDASRAVKLAERARAACRTERERASASSPCTCVCRHMYHSDAGQAV